MLSTRARHPYGPVSGPHDFGTFGVAVVPGGTAKGRSRTGGAPASARRSRKRASVVPSVTLSPPPRTAPGRRSPGGRNGHNGPWGPGDHGAEAVTGRKRLRARSLDEEPGPEPYTERATGIEPA